VPLGTHTGDGLLPAPGCCCWWSGRPAAAAASCLHPRAPADTDVRSWRPDGCRVTTRERGEGGKHVPFSCCCCCCCCCCITGGAGGGTAGLRGSLREGERAGGSRGGGEAEPARRCKAAPAVTAPRLALLLLGSTGAACETTICTWSPGVLFAPGPAAVTCCGGSLVPPCCEGSWHTAAPAAAALPPPAAAGAAARGGSGTPVGMVETMFELRWVATAGPEGLAVSGGPGAAPPAFQTGPGGLYPATPGCGVPGVAPAAGPTASWVGGWATSSGTRL
jgi:hypothetical protein